MASRNNQNSNEQFNLALTRNIDYFNSYYNRLKLLAVTQFKWNDLPDSCNARFLENTLFDFGRAIFINDPKLGYMNLRAIPAGKMNVYEEFTRYTAFSIGYSEMYDADDCVYIRNNPLVLPTSIAIDLYAKQLMRLQNTIDINTNAQKTPILIKCSEKQRLTLKNMYMKYEGGEPFIFGDKSLDDNLLGILKTDAPYLIDRLQLQKQMVWNEVMGYLGINNANQDKKERLVTNEVEANNEQIQLSAKTMLASRENACELINRMYGLNVSVEMRTPQETKSESPNEQDREDEEIE